MDDETNAEVKETGKEEPKEVKKADGGEDVKKLREELERKTKELEESEKSRKYHSYMNERYNSDPEFAAAYDELMAGKKKEQEAAKKLASEEDEVDPEEKRVRDLEKRLENAEKVIGETQEMFEYKSVAEAREKINDKYDNAVRKMAEDAGYEFESSAYRVLYADIIQECRSIAHEFKLVTKDGIPDPLLAFKSDFIKKAFENAFKRQEEAGFVDANRRAVLKRRQEQKPVTDELSRYFKPERLKTPEGRAAALRDAFRHKFRSSFKIT